VVGIETGIAVSEIPWFASSGEGEQHDGDDGAGFHQNCSTFRIEVSMKLAWRKTILWP
jgi:hypothetical protein